MLVTGDLQLHDGGPDGLWLWQLDRVIRPGRWECLGLVTLPLHAACKELQIGEAAQPLSSSQRPERRAPVTRRKRHSRAPVTQEAA